MENGDILKDIFIKITNEDVSLNSIISDFELIVTAIIATSQKTAAALMAAHAPTNTCQNISNFNSNKDNTICF